MPRAIISSTLMDGHKNVEVTDSCIIEPTTCSLSGPSLARGLRGALTLLNLGVSDKKTERKIDIMLLLKVS